MTSRPPVFVIDDEESVRRSLERLLRALGIPSRAFDSAESFLAAYAGDEAGCLLVAIRMPGMSGLDLIAELERRHISLPAIVMTGHTDSTSLKRLDALHTIGFLEKPFSVGQLQDILERWWSTLDRGTPPA